MSNQSAKKDKGMSAQQNLFDTELSAGSLEHLSLGIKQRLSKMLQPRDRYIVAAMISRSTGIEVKGSVFEKILSSDPQYQPTMVQVVAACKLAGRFDPFEFSLEELGAGVLTAEDMPLIRLARKRMELERLEQECAQLEAQCKIRR
ncbi:MAG: hypothetical protein PHC49_10770 [Desulfuromonadaceae bacterium]|nr:hypothetical protein [Desulfuromonadaceae bacterium]